MPQKCVVPGCTSEPQHVSLHRFPKDRTALDKWKEAILKPVDWMPIACDRVCSLHFDPAVVSKCGSKARLLECAVPRIAAYEEQGRTTASLDHQYALPSAATLKRRLDIMIDRADADAKKCRNSNKREARLKQTLASVLKTAEERRLVDAEMKVKLQAFSDIPTELFSRPTSKYTDEQKDFALTLHMYSAKAYDFVRESGVRLPDPRTLARWLSTINDKPGFSIPMLDSLADKSKQDPKQYEDCTLCLDGMSIKQAITFDQSTGTLTGFEDLGDGDEEGEEEAKEALVFMLVGVRRHWKAPIG